MASLGVIPFMKKMYGDMTDGADDSINKFEYQLHLFRQLRTKLKQAHLEFLLGDATNAKVKLHYMRKLRELEDDVFRDTKRY